ncbi:MAG: SpoVA/SpoVAEb family sporulation membrane protein [Clostridia bacterium]|nr:SpoVA/SpoVAEb family sporulation membrane protein [Clostridia bacterium]
MLNKKEYEDLVKETVPKSREIKTLIWAFIVGGIICVIGQVVSDIIKLIFNGIDELSVANVTSAVMIFFGVVLTGFGVYDKIGAHAGGGSIVPITGFANSVVSPAMEYNRDGVVFGIMSKMFVIAGPIIVSGVVASIGVGIVYWVVSLF